MKWYSSIKGKRFNVKFESLDCKNILVTDISVWNTVAPYKLPDDFEIELKPLVGESLKARIIPGKTVEILLGDRYLIDGIWCITAKIGNGIFTLYRPVLCRMECCKRQYLSNMLIRPDLDMTNLDKIERYINLIKLNCDIGQVETAVNIIKLANRELKFLNCNCN